MERNNYCRCCLRRPPDRDMKIPYINFGKTEIYSDMLKECFEIHLTKLLSENECGICEVCVGRLRDASDFKLQVLNIQAQLQSLLDKGKLVKEEQPLVKSELPENDKELINFGEVIKLEISDPLPGGVETEFKEFELINTEVSGGFKQEPMLDYAFGHPSYSMTNEHNISGIRIKKEHTCKTCGQSFPKKILLNMHKKIHKYSNDNTCEICNKQFKYKCKLKMHRLIHTKTFVCDICNKKFARAYSLNRHKLVHSGEKPFSCDECDKKFSDASYLNAHKRVHAGETPYTCDICKAKFIRKNNLISHIGRHQGKKYYRCNICFKRFWDYPSLYLHKQTHTGEIYKCDQCDKVFTYKQGLASHLKTHAERTPYSCDFCAKQLATFASLQRHKLVHTGERAYSCDVCNNSFRHKHNLINHKLTHTGEKLHCCEICGKQFARKDNLNTHLATHAEGINYSCELCTKSYSTKEGLRQHRRSHRTKKIAKFIIKKLAKKTINFQKSTDYIQVNT